MTQLKTPHESPIYFQSMQQLMHATTTNHIKIRPQLESRAPTMDHFILLLSLLGLTSLLKTSFHLLQWLHRNFLRPPKPLARCGSWAIVTGATDGIGKSFAFHLARRGLNLVLISRSAERLDSVAKDIEIQSPNVHIKTVALDFTEVVFTEEDIRRGMGKVEEAIEGLDVGILINNAGVTYRRAAYFDEVEEGVLGEVVRVNVEGTSWMSRVVMKGMVERGRGAVVNVGSGAACVLPSFPLYTVYSATKAYIDQFSRSLYVEYKKKGIDVQCQVPMYVATKMSTITKSSFFVPSSDTYAHYALSWIGHEPRCTPYWPHSVLWHLLSLLPEFVVNYWRLSYCLDIRMKEHMQDDAKEKEQ